MCRAHLDQGVRGAEAGSAWAAANVSLRGGDLRESAMLNPFGQTPWAAVRRAQCSILCSRSRIRGTGILQVSRRETLEKPETDAHYCRTSVRMEGFRGVAAQSVLSSSTKP